MERAELRYKQTGAAVEGAAEPKATVAKLESHYEAKIGRGKEEEIHLRMLPQTEKLLQELDRRFGKG